MSEFSLMEKLLDGVVVEWKPLGDVGTFIRGNGMQKKDFTESGFPAIHYGQIYTRYGLSATKTFTFVSEAHAKSLRKARTNDLLLATTSENDEDVVKPLVLPQLKSEESVNEKCRVVEEVFGARP